MATAKTAASAAKTVKSTKQKTLVIVESPSKAKTVGKYLGSSYKVVASVGHVRDLPKSKLGINIENDFIESLLLGLSRFLKYSKLKNL